MLSGVLVPSSLAWCDQPCSLLKRFAIRSALSFLVEQSVLSDPANAVLEELGGGGGLVYVFMPSPPWLVGGF